MSQQKVDEYKKNKANRAKQAAKERTMRRVEYGICALVLAGLVAWGGLSAYQKAVKAENAKVESYELDTTDIVSFINDVQTEAAAQD